MIGKQNIKMTEYDFELANAHLRNLAKKQDGIEESLTAEQATHQNVRTKFYENHFVTLSFFIFNLIVEMLN